MDLPGGEELLILFIIIVFIFGVRKIPELAKGFGKGIKNFQNEMEEVDREIELAGYKNEPQVEGLTIQEKFNLADKYCYSNREGEARNLLKNIIKNGTDNEVKQALEYTKDYCDSMFKTLVELAITLGRIKTGADIL